LRLPSTIRPTDRACLQLAPSTPLFGSAFRSAWQLAPPAFRPALPLDPTSDSHRMSYSPIGLQFVSSLRLQLAFYAQPSGGSSTRVSDRPQARLSISPCSSRCLPISGPPFDVSPACAFDPSSGSAFLLSFRLAPSGQPFSPGLRTSTSDLLRVISWKEH
jgi:hypothetical protein